MSGKSLPQGAKIVPIRAPMSLSREQARKAFGKRLTAARVLAGYKARRHFAEIMGFEEMTYGRWERGEVEPSFADLIRICETLNTTPTTLIIGRSPQK